MYFMKFSCIKQTNKFKFTQHTKASHKNMLKKNLLYLKNTFWKFDKILFASILKNIYFPHKKPEKIAYAFFYIQPHTYYMQ